MAVLTILFKGGEKNIFYLKMELVYKHISDELIQTQLLLFQESDITPMIDFNTENQVEEIMRSYFEDMDKLKKSEILEQDAIFIFFCIDRYNDLDISSKSDFHKKIRNILTKNVNKDIFLQIIEQINESNNPQCIEDFSVDLLSTISIKPELVTEYQINEISLADIAINLMNLNPEIAFPSLICLFSKTLDVFNLNFLNDIKKLIEITNDPYFYGITICRFSELAKELTQSCQLISPLDSLLSKNIYKYYLKSVSLLSRRENQHISFFNAFKNIFNVINCQFLKIENLHLIDDEDILNCLSFIKQFSLHIKQIPRLCQETNIETINNFIEDDKWDIEIKLQSVSILANLCCNDFFQTPDSIQFIITNTEKIAKDLPFTLKTEALDIYYIMADIICISDIDKLLITDFFIDFLFQFFGSEDSQSIEKVSDICKIVALKSPSFKDFLSDQLENNEEATSCDKFVFDLLEFVNHVDCQ